MIPGVLCGRRAEQTTLDALLDAACAGRGGVAVLSGPAGIGKSALLGWLIDAARGRNAEVTTGRAWEFADAPPYFPLAPVLRDLGLDASQASSPFEFWERVLVALAERTKARPLVVCLEDVHAADLMTLDLLVFLSQPARALPLLIAVTARDQDHRLEPRARARLERLMRDGTLLPLQALGAKDVADLAAACMGRAPTSHEMERLVERAGGNPLFVVELARAIDERAALSPTIRQLVLDRLAHLPEDCRRAIEAGAVIGRELTAGMVAKVRDTLPARIVDDLLPAVRSGLLVEPRPGVFVFGHVLERDAIEEALGAEQRAHLHARVFRALERVEPTPEVVLERARHAIGGLGVVNEGEAVELVRSTIAVLSERGAHDRAFGLWRRLEDARVAGMVGVARTVAERCAAARLARLAGRHADAVMLCEEAIDLARASGDAEGLAEAALTLGSELRPAAVDRSLIDALREALAGIGDRSPDLAVRIEARLAAALQPAKDPSEPVAMARRTIELIRTSTNDGLAVEVLENAGSALVDYVSLHEQIACGKELLARASRIGDHARTLRALSRIAMAQAQLPDIPAFSETVDEMLGMARGLGLPRLLWRPLLFSSMRAMMFGRFEDSERLLVELDQIATLTDEGALAFAIKMHRLFRLREVGTAEELEGALGWIPELARGTPEGLALEAFTTASVLVRLGDRDAVCRAFTPTARTFQPHPWDIALLALIAEAAAMSDADDLKRRLVEVFERVAECGCPTGHVTYTYEGPASRFLGLLSASLGDTARGEELLRDALCRARRAGLRPSVARTAAELASLLGKAGRADEARSLVEEARAIAGDIGLRNLPDLPEDVGAPSPAEASAPRCLALRREGDGWSVSDGTVIVHVRDVRGMMLLSRLADHQGEEIHVLALSSDEGTALEESHAGEQIDEKAKREYRRRLDEIETGIEEQGSFADPSRRERLERERDAIIAELRGALGLGGATRKAGSITERARVNVQRRLKDAVARIAEVHPALGEAISASLRTGTYCSLKPLGAPPAQS